ncbi:MAG: monovalent cation/H(+) antiporter subunit G [Halomonas sp.]|uniref:monovalent cation/H(+) antiporter subunit G n=1 Tax=Halomonas sp. TaxID=1486246 RepID=UPI002ACEECA4|nr:monovalent cation/H(+) antiporter subunit G [Halomonas sp.]MDZ7852583.1 monovalent cation/H(+) antiporter subunit G [Halomonas sp.]
MILPIIGGLLSIVGAVFLLLASIGLVRMPDVYNRMQAGTKATTLGSILFLIGIAVANPPWSGRIVLLVVFIVFTNPISSHALIRAAAPFGDPPGGENRQGRSRGHAACGSATAYPETARKREARYR